MTIPFSTSKQTQTKLKTLLSELINSLSADNLSKFRKSANLNIIFYFAITICIIFSNVIIFIRIYIKDFLLRYIKYDNYEYQCFYLFQLL